VELWTVVTVERATIKTKATEDGRRRRGTHRSRDDLSIIKQLGVTTKVLRGRDDERVWHNSALDTSNYCDGTA